MVPWPVIGLVVYGLLSWFSLKSSSNPVNPCYNNHRDSKRRNSFNNNNNCIHPSVHVGDELFLDLWIVQVSKNQQNKYTKQWKQVSTCSQLQFTMPSTGKLPMDITTSPDNNCTITIPESARLRWSDDDNKHNKNNNGGGGPLQAKFRLYKVVQKDESSSSSPNPQSGTYSQQQQQQQQQQNLVGEIPVELTRIITPPKPSAFSFTSATTTGDGNRATTKRKLLQDNKDSNTTSSLSPSSSSTYYQYVPKWKYGSQKLLLRFVADTNSYAPPYHRRDGIHIKQSIRNQTAYLPLIYVDDNGLMHSSSFNMAPPVEEEQEEEKEAGINDSCSELDDDDNNKTDDTSCKEKSDIDNKRPPPINLNIQISSITPTWDVINQQVTVGVDMATKTMGLSGVELDEIRYWLRDERLYRFALTQIISTLHIWIDYMAFRDEIRFYRGKKDLGGVSASSVLTHLACSVIIFLYLCDGGGTSWVVLLSILSGIVVEVWKVWKLLRPTFCTTYPFVSIRQIQSKLEQETIKYDTIAMKWLMMFLYPIVIGWSIYALHRYEYASWYSWFISNMANAVYTFGFITLCPQLYVNYRLKSVAHLPWKVFVYKVFNTFVDDVFAFLIEMPWKHRIMTLRDDVVFLMFLGQAYIYRVDKSRTNEFGYSYADDENDGDNEQKQDTKQQPPVIGNNNDEGTPEAITTTKVVTDQVHDDPSVKPKDKDV